jgi:DNA-binding MarR family transcriptional regulator
MSHAQSPVKRPASEASRATTLASELRALNGKLKRRLREEAPPGDLTWPQLSVVGLLEREGAATLTALARAENMRSQSMGAILAPLEEAGLVVRASDPSDGRQTILSLTEKCRAWIKENRMARDDWLSRVIQTKLSPEEQDELKRALELLRRITDA